MQPLADPSQTVDAVVIGRNEGARLLTCLAALRGQVRRVIYVDSGSTDGSAEAAAAMGAEVVALDMARPFTAARARNAGLARLAGPDQAAFVQLIDGDCELRDGFVAAALAAFADHTRAVVVCGRRRERFPQATLWNRLCDREWDTPLGEAMACGGDALMRLAAVQAVGGYREDLIAGEEPELCQRLRRAGGQIWRIDAEMTWHDAAMTRFGQWWKRTRRAGHAFAEGAALHGQGPDRHWVAETRRALLWGLGVPVAALLAGLIHPAGFLLILLWPLQVLRLARRWQDPQAAVFSVLGKLPEALGVLEYHLGRLRGRKRGLIEYK
ncbi:glycosyltransferase family 2 protein [Neotabrizicola sp. VNH66]|uniref:glycosyltransferase family 2 protein n=1 Tax=Neotabrizicola sp. VNH66 TaxID=3400918 RepID=UPI003BFF5B2F